MLRKRIEGKRKGKKMSRTQRCRECGRPFSVEVVGAFSPEDEGFCSEGCREAARKRWREKALRKWRETGRKTLAKWEKALERDTEKRKNRIHELSSAMRGDDPRAIEKAIEGSLLKRMFRRLLIGLLLLLTGLLLIAISKSADKTAGESTGGGVEGGVNRNGILR